MLDSLSGSLTARTVRRGETIGQYPGSERSTLLAAFAAEMGWSEAKARKILYGTGTTDCPPLAEVCAGAHRAHIATNRLPELARFRAPSEAAIRGPIAPLSDAIVLTGQRLDLSEDEAETAYHLNPCRETAQAWIRAMDRETPARLETRAGLAKKWELL